MPIKYSVTYNVTSKECIAGNGWVLERSDTSEYINPLMFVVVMIFILFSIFGHIHPLRFVIVVIIIIFAVMFTNFGHIHLVIFIRSC